MKNKIVKFSLIKAICVIAVIILIIVGYKNIIYIKIKNNEFARQTDKIYEENKDPVFKIKQILIYSSANAIDNSEGQTLQDLGILQFTDLGIYIDNNNEKQELNEKNTVKELYIDNIKLETTKEDKGNKFLTYKSPIKFGKFENLNKPSDENKIEYDILYTNEENSKNDYTKAAFFTDCSNPITLGYINKNIVRNYKISKENNLLSFNGSILKTAKVDLDKISPKISFCIHIINNLNEEYICNLNIDNILKDDKNSIYSGYMLILNNFNENEYTFFRKK